MLGRVWILQLVVVFGDVRVFGLVYPALVRIATSPHVVELYLAETAAAFLLLCAFVYRMSRLTLAPRFRDPRHLVVSVSLYLLQASVVMAIVYSAPNLVPGLSGGITLLEVAVSLMVTVNFATLLAVTVYSRFDHGSIPRRTTVNRVVDAWVASFDWVEEAEGTREKREGYEEFLERTDAVAELLESAATEDGLELRDDFEDWRTAFETRSLLSQEAILEGGAGNERLRREHERLNRIVERLELVTQ